ncbi:MAG: hypothetical protein IPH46_17415 [Bacteroidetes bacterium]|nr:hypothetical protein [Bacteroidota bacterium]
MMDFYTCTLQAHLKPVKKSWLSNYSMNACLDLENGLVPCNTDANADGTTNVSDLNLLLIQFGIICD